MSSTNRGGIRASHDNYPTPPWVVRALLEWRVGRAPQRGSTGPAVCAALGIPELILEPCAGDGRILELIHRYRSSRASIDRNPDTEFAAIELRDTPVPRATPPSTLWYGGVDFLSEAGSCSVDTALAMASSKSALGRCAVGVVTNPPFGIAQRVIEKVLALCDRADVSSDHFEAWFLLRVGFLGTGERSEFLRRNMPSNILVLSDRPKFVSVCKGAATQDACGRTYPLGHAERCECGGTVGKGSDSSEYAWVCWRRKGHTGAADFEILDTSALWKDEPW